jgi:hypothetical protein
MKIIEPPRTPREEGRKRYKSLGMVVDKYLKIIRRKVVDMCRKWNEEKRFLGI